MKQTELIFEIEGKASENDYEANSFDIDVSTFDKVTIHIFEVGKTNSISFSIDTSLKGTRWRNMIKDVSIAAGEDDGETVIDALEKIRIQIKSTTADSHGKYNLYVRGMPS